VQVKISVSKPRPISDDNMKVDFEEILGQLIQTRDQ